MSAKKKATEKKEKKQKLLVVTIIVKIRPENFEDISDIADAISNLQGVGEAHVEDLDVETR